MSSGGSEPVFTKRDAHDKNDAIVSIEINAPSDLDEVAGIERESINCNVLKKSISPLVLLHTNTVDFSIFRSNLSKGETDISFKIIVAIFCFFTFIMSQFVFTNLNSYQIKACIMSAFFIQWIIFALYELYKSESISVIRVINQRID